MKALLSTIAAFTSLAVTGAAHADVTGIRTGIHPDYVRVVFDADGKPGTSLEQSGGMVTLTSTQPLGTGVSMPELTEAFEPYVKQWRLVTTEGNTTLEIDVQEGVSARLVESDALAYMDLKREDALPPVSAGVSAIAKAAEAMNAADKKRAEQAAKAAAQPKPEEPAQVAEEKPAPSDDIGRSRLEKLDVMVQNRPFESRLVFNWDVTVPAAIFQRAGQLWIIFETATQIEHPGADFSASERIRSAKQLSHPFGTVLVYDLAPDQSVVAQRENTRWEIEVKETMARPRDPIVMTRQMDPVDGHRAFFALGDAGSRFVLKDPVVGDNIIVVPSSVDGKGMASPVSGPGFLAMQTAQGAAFTELGDGIDVRRFRNGAAVFGAQGLPLSKTGAELSAADGARAVRLIDLAGWAGDPAVPETKRNHALLHAISMAPEVNLNDRRSAYARFLIGRGFAVDALGVMEIMKDADPNLVKNPTYRAMRGVAQLLARRFEGAYEDLMASALDSEPDAYLWRAVAAQATGRHSEALTYFERGADVLSLYNAKDQARFQLAAVRSAQALGQIEDAEVELRRLEALDAPTPYKEWGQLERALTHLRNEAPDEAQKILGVLATTAPRDVKARARYHLAMIALRQEEATQEETIDRLEKLRYAWRGDDFELELLDTVSTLYWKEENFREALGSLRQAVTYFKLGERTRAMTRTMEERFEELYLEGRADQLDPVTALALYYDFRELTPLGSNGDAMVRRLADRLVNVELFDRAAQLLEHQVTYRLEGIAQAAVAERLAMVHLLNDQPDEALRVLRATRASNMTKDLRASRFRIEARALIDTKRYQEAIVTLESDKSREADMLRADAAWGAKEWGLVRDTSKALLAESGNTPANDDERRHILRWAIAATLGDAPGELKEIRTRFGDAMRRGLYSEAFEAIAGAGVTNGGMPRLAGNLSDVATLEAFMDSYRAAFRPDAGAVEGR